MARAWLAGLAACRDALALLAVVGVVAGASLGALGYEARLRAERQAIELVGQAPTEHGGGWSRREMRVRQGEAVRLRLSSVDVTHGFLIPDLGIAADPIVPGTYQIVTFVAERPGVYRYYCNVLCSHRHGAMTGLLVVEPAT